MISEVLGTRPVGWRAPSGLTTPRTLELIYDAGYTYDSSFGDEDVPYRVCIGHGRSDEIVELPWAWPLDDAPYYAYPGTIRRPRDVAQLWIEEFDAAYAETAYFMLVCHPRYSGRPARIVALERLINHIRAQDGIWFAHCSEIASAVRESSTAPRYPAPALLASEADCL